jgi:ribosomal protein S18 acetylase RimI-like enzyme
LEALVTAAEAFYDERGGPTLFQVTTASAPHGLGPLLQAHGYRAAARTLVERAETRDVVERSRPGGFEIDLCEAVTDPWFETYWSVESGRGRRDADAAVYRNVLLAPPLPSVFAVAWLGSQVVGVGELVIERGWAGVQCMATSPAHRRQGVARAVLGGLAKEAQRLDVARMYLAVMADNRAALDLYARAGFRPVHEYSYFGRDP